MKAEKLAYWVLGGAVLAVALVGLYMVNRGHVREQAELSGTIQAAQVSFPQLVAGNRGLINQLNQQNKDLTDQLNRAKTDLTDQLNRAKAELGNAESQLAGVKTSLANATARVPQSVQSIEYAERLFAMAASKGLTIQVVTSTEPAQEKGPSSPLSFTLVNFSVDIRGNLGDIVDLVGILATDQAFSTATIRSVSVTVPEPLTAAEKAELTPAEVTELEMPSAAIALAVYGY